MKRKKHTWKPFGYYKDNPLEETPLDYKPKPTDTYNYESFMFKFWSVLGLLTFSAIIAISLAMYNENLDEDSEAVASDVVAPVAVAIAAPEPVLTPEELKAAEEEAKKKAVAEEILALQNLKKAIGETNANKDVNSKEAIELYVGVMNEATKRAGGAGQFGDPAVTNAALDLIATVKKRQLADLPVLRRKWAKHLKNAMWEQDVEVSVGGKANTVLTMVGGVYATNANIKFTQEAMRNVLHLLRFKRVNYRWYDYNDGYYYTIKSPHDGVVI